jgi:hypothetical protein
MEQYKILKKLDTERANRLFSVIRIYDTRENNTQP